MTRLKIILLQLCGGLSTVEMGYSGGGWVVLGWWLGVSPPLLLFFFCTLVCDFFFFFFFGVYFSLFLHLIDLGILWIFPSLCPLGKKEKMNGERKKKYIVIHS